MNDQSHTFQVFPWNDNLVVGIPKIDEQHRVLIDLINELATQLVGESSVELNRVFDELTAYANYHFETEENIWAPSFKDDEWFFNHQRTHASFIDDILAIKDQDNDRPLQQTVEKIVEFLVRWLAFHIIDNDKRMAAVLQGLEAGMPLEEAKARADDELKGSFGVLVDTVLAMNSNLSNRTLDLMRERAERQQAQEALKDANRQLEEASITDELTGLYNRRYFDTVMDKELRRARRDNKLFTLIYFDIDHFKKLNDNYGHAQGDVALKTIGAALREISRRPADFVFRVGGEEFGVVVDTQTQDGAVEFAEVIRKTIEDLNIPHAYSETSDRVTVSVGVASRIPQPDDSPESFLKEADARLYKAKHSGRNRVVASD
jgi:diguanylate cyclase (GGDEF)-like protein/hemerythrin-like metal-binding protein